MTKETNYVKVGDRGLVLKAEVISAQKSGLSIIVNVGPNNNLTFGFGDVASCEAAFKQLVIDLN